AGLVAEKVANRDAVLAVLAELGPIGGDGRVDVELAARGEHVRAQRHGAFGARPHDTDGVFAPRPCGARIGDASPEVDYVLAADGHAHRAADLAPLGEVALELLLDLAKPGIATSIDRHGAIEAR